MPKYLVKSPLRGQLKDPTKAIQPSTVLDGLVDESEAAGLIAAGVIEKIPEAAPAADGDGELKSAGKSGSKK